MRIWFRKKMQHILKAQKLITSMQIEIISFEDGLAKIVDKILTAKRKPAVISIHGFPNSGKTELIKRVSIKLAKEHKIYGARGMSGDSLDKMGFYSCAQAQYMLLEHMIFTDACDEISQKLFGHKQDLTAYIAQKVDEKKLAANCEKFKQEYGLIINNPNAKNKNSQYCADFAKPL